jgi:hypothetical protein
MTLRFLGARARRPELGRRGRDDIHADYNPNTHAIAPLRERDTAGTTGCLNDPPPTAATSRRSYATLTDLAAAGERTISVNRPWRGPR